MGCAKCGGKGCNQCLTSILNGEDCLIPEPLCSPICPPIVGCEFPVFSQCVTYTGPNLGCTGILTNFTLNAALAYINNAICNIAPPSGVNCNYYASCTDPCPSSLVNKVGSGTPPNPYVNNTLGTLNVSLSTNGITSCQTVDIQEKPWVFTPFSLPVGIITPNTPTPSNPTGIGFPLTGFVAGSAFSWGVRQGYPTTSNLLEVKLSGQIQLLVNNTVITLLTTIPLDKAPITAKLFTGLGLAPGLAPVSNYPWSLTILTNGNIYLIVNTVPPNPVAMNVVISFDGLSYVKN